MKRKDRHVYSHPQLPGPSSRARQAAGIGLALAILGIMAFAGLRSTRREAVHKMDDRPAAPSLADGVTKAHASTSSNTAGSQVSGRTGESNSPVSAASPASADESLDEKATRLANEANAELARGQGARAIELYLEALKARPNDEVLHYNLGAAYARHNQPAKAEQAYRQALELFEDYPEAHNNLGNLLAREGKVLEAEKHLLEAIQLMPEYAVAHNNLGTLYQSQRRTQDAVVAFQKAVDLDPNYWQAQLNLGQARAKLGDTAKAVAALEEALRLKPDLELARKALERIEIKGSNSFGR